ncbi:MAG: hypothetical protein HQM13_00485 [SAR324 cluster bacterium]|nr:hypothetical protein [SAR324 cluster bacterium]
MKDKAVIYIRPSNENTKKINPHSYRKKEIEMLRKTPPNTEVVATFFDTKALNPHDFEDSPTFMAMIDFCDKFGIKNTLHGVLLPEDD